MKNVISYYVLSLRKHFRMCHGGREKYHFDSRRDIDFHFKLQELYLKRIRIQVLYRMLLGRAAGIVCAAWLPRKF